MAKKSKGPKQVEALTHDEASRKNIPTAELQSFAEQMEEIEPVKPVRYERATPLPKGATRERDSDLDPQLIWNGARIRLSRDQVRQLEERGEVEIGGAQLVWRGKDQQDWSDLVVQAPPIYIQEKVHPKVIIDDLIRRSKERAQAKTDAPDLFANFNGLPDPEARLEFYQHDQHWSNRMILGDSLYVMASLATRENLRGKVQCIYIDPPYGIKFNSNWQVSTKSKDVRDGKREDVSREPEQVKAFRDTWKDGIHSYLTYLRDRLSVARELLTESGSIFVQIGDTNVHRIRSLMDEVFSEECFVSEIVIKKKGAQKSTLIDPVNDFILWYSRSPRNSGAIKFRHLFEPRPLDYETVDYFSKIELPDGQILNLKDLPDASVDYRLFPQSLALNFPGGQLLRQWPITNGGYRENQMAPVSFQGRDYTPPRNRCWSHTSRPNDSGMNGMDRVKAAERLMASGISLDFKRYYEDFPFKNIANWWDGFRGALDQVYVVQTNERLVERCLLMATDPGDLVLDPTCGSGTTAYVAEQWGRRWITIDTSRVALALARARIMGARYPYYLLADTPDGRAKEGEASGKLPFDVPTHHDIRQGFVYRRATYVTSGMIANNAEIDVIWAEFQTKLEPLRAQLNEALGQSWEEWQIPRETDDSWSDNVKGVHRDWWALRIARQKKIDDSIARNADVEFLYDRPYEDKSRVRVAGPFTVESLSPHRVVPADEEELLDTLKAAEGKRRRAKLIAPPTDFAEMVLENLRTAGVQQHEKKDSVHFTSLQGWPGEYIGAEGRFMEGDSERRAAIFLGPEFGTVSRLDLVAAAREASEARFDVLIACAFNFDAHASELTRLGPLPILKAKMNPDLHMAGELKNTGKGNLFVVFGEPDIDIEDAGDGMIQVRVKGVDVFDPNTGEIRSNDTEGIAAWFIDTAYDEENFFVRHAYFLGAQDPYKSLKTALKAEIDEDAWATLYRDVSRPFPRPAGGRIAVKVINHFGDEVMKVFGV